MGDELSIRALDDPHSTIVSIFTTQLKRMLVIWHHFPKDQGKNWPKSLKLTFVKKKSSQWEGYLAQLQKKNTSTTPHPPLRFCFGKSPAPLLETVELPQPKAGWSSYSTAKSCWKPTYSSFPYPAIKSLDLGEEKKKWPSKSQKIICWVTAWKTYPDGLVWFQPLPWPSVTNSVRYQLQHLQSFGRQKNLTVAQLLPSWSTRKSQISRLNTTGIPSREEAQGLYINRFPDLLFW